MRRVVHTTDHIGDYLLGGQYCHHCHLPLTTYYMMAITAFMFRDMTRWLVVLVVARGSRDRRVFVVVVAIVVVVVVVAIAALLEVGV